MSKRHLQKRALLTRARLSVVPTSVGWVIEGAPSAPARAFKTQREALTAARKLINDREGGEIIVRGRDGRVRQLDTYALGEEALEKVNAVEGIALDEGLKRELHLLDRRKLSAEERREWLIAKYGPRRGKLRRRA